MEIFCGIVFFLGLFATPIVLSIVANNKATRLQAQMAKLETELAVLQRLVREMRREAEPPQPHPLPEVAPLPWERPLPEVHPLPEPIVAAAPPPPFEQPAAGPSPSVPPAPVPPPPIPPSEQPAAPSVPPAPPIWKRIDWEELVGVKLFSRIGGVATVIAAIYFLKYSVDQGWISPPVRAAIGLLVGSALLVVCELRVARGYKFTANAMLGAGIAILYSTLFAIHALWHLLPAVVVFGGMIVVTAVAVALSLRRDALFIALLGMLGGFATPALLSTGENRPFGLFSYLLLLNAGLAWVAYRKRWPALTIGSLVFSVLYQWTWIAKFLDAAQLPLAAGIFVVFGIAAATALWIGRREDVQQTWFDRVGQFGAALPLLFALFAATVPAYGERFHVLFGFLFLIAAGLAAITVLRKTEWLHAIGMAATLLTFGIWLGVSYRPEAWPAVLAWTSAFVVLYLAAGTRLRSRVTVGAAGLFFVFPALIQLEPHAASPALLFPVLFVLLALTAAYAIRYEQGLVYYVAAFFAILTETLWSVKHLTPERLYSGLAIYAAFGLLFLAVPALARRAGRALMPENGVVVTAIVSLAMLLFLTFDNVAAGALWGLAILLAVLLVGAIAEARFLSRPMLAAVAVVLSWIVLASWWEAASLDRALIPALFVIAIFGVLVILASAWAGKPFAGQTHLALVGHAFLVFVAASPALAFPPWPFLAVLGVLDLAIGIAALHLRRGSLLLGSAILSQLVLLTWSMNTELAPWPNVALASALAVAAYALLWYTLARVILSDAKDPLASDAGDPSPSARLRMTFAHAAIAALFLGHIVAIGAASSSEVPLFGTALATHAVLVIATFFLAARTGMHALAVLSVPFTAIATATAVRGATMPAREFTFAAVLYALYVAYPLVLGKRVQRAFAPYLAAVLASLAFFFFARDAIMGAGLGYAIGVLPIGQALVMLVLLIQLLRMETDLWSGGPPLHETLGRRALVAAAALAFVTVAVPLQLDKQWITIAWALEGAALVWLFRRIPHRGLLAWAAALLAAVFVRLMVNPAVLAYHPPSERAILNWYFYTYLVSALAFFAAAYFAPRERRTAIGVLNAAGTVLLFALLNIEIADFFSTGPTLTFNFLSSSLMQDLTYTIGWATFAIGLLVAGILVHARSARVAAIALLVVTIFKCFLHDLARLGGLYRIASFLGLALALVMVSVLLQKFVLSRRVPEVSSEVSS